MIYLHCGEEIIYVQLYCQSSGQRYRDGASFILTNPSTDNAEAIAVTNVDPVTYYLTYIYKVNSDAIYPWAYYRLTLL